jgi:hypothetical protein
MLNTSRLSLCNEVPLWPCYVTCHYNLSTASTNHVNDKTPELQQADDEMFAGSSTSALKLLVRKAWSSEDGEPYSLRGYEAKGLDKSTSPRNLRTRPLAVEPQDQDLTPSAKMRRENRSKKIAETITKAFQILGLFQKIEPLNCRALLEPLSCRNGQHYPASK